MDAIKYFMINHEEEILAGVIITIISSLILAITSKGIVVIKKNSF